MNMKTLKELCEGASPGQWEYGNQAVWHSCDTEAISEVAEFIGNDEDGQLIARCNPSTMLAVLEKLEDIASGPGMVPPCEIAQDIIDILNGKSHFQ